MTNALSQRFLAARSAIIEECFSDLNAQQRRAVLKTQGPVLVLAGAGSGKTTVLIQRMANLLRFGIGSDTAELPDGLLQSDVELMECYLSTHDPALKNQAQSLCAWQPVEPWRIIAITFTNKAAGEMKERLRRMLGEEAEDIWAMTFHSACCRMLRRDANRLGYTSDFTIYDSGDTQSVIKAILKDKNLDIKTYPPKTVANMISKAKDACLTPEDYINRASNDIYNRWIGLIFEEYQKRLKNANAMDFDDLLVKTVELLEQNPDILEYYQNKFRFILVDEYQDTNSLQYRFTALLAQKSGNICVVGDDDQSIYRFRGATIENILSFEKNYPNACVIRLEQNYRSTSYILQAANAVISNNRGRKGKTLWTAQKGGDKLRVYEAANETEEANWVAQQILSGRQDGGQFSDYAVLYRTNAQSNAMEIAFRRSGVPYRIIGGTRFYDRAEVKDMLAYLSLINNRADDLRLKRIINNPPRGLGGRTLDTVELLADRNHVCMYDIVSDPYSYPELARSAGKLMSFTVMIEELSKKLQTMPLQDFYRDVVEQSGYKAMLLEKNDETNKTRIENIQELGSTIAGYAENAEMPSLADFLEEVSLYTDIEQYDPQADAAVMMTMHAAKGLEFSDVFVVGLEEGLFPSARSLQSQTDLEEERRLCYVALTRAKEHLYVSYARSRMIYGRTTTNRPSRFVDELPQGCVQWLSRRQRPDFRESIGFPNEYGIENLTYGSGGNTGKPAAVKADTVRAGTQSRNASGAPSTAPKPTVLSDRKTASFNLRTGDTVEHRSFGRGVVISVQAMGNDALVEIAFDGVGTKKLMANTAAKFMKKL